MFPHLLGQKALYHLSNDDMAKIIKVSRQTYESKSKSGRFTPAECQLYCEHFKKTFDYLFYTEDPRHNPAHKKSLPVEGGRGGT